MLSTQSFNSYYQEGCKERPPPRFWTHLVSAHTKTSMFWDKLAPGMFLFLEQCSEKAVFATHLEKVCIGYRQKWESLEKIKHRKEQTGWENCCRLCVGEKGLSYQKDVLQRSYKDSIFFWGLEMLYLTHITPQQSGWTASLRSYMTVKSLRYKYIERITEILCSCLFVICCLVFFFF